MLRGNHPARIDDKGRLKIPNGFRSFVESQYGLELFVTSVTGEYVRLYPMAVWLEIERKLAAVPSTNPSKQRFLDRVNFFGQAVPMDKQGRVLASPAPARDRGHGGRGERARPAEPPRGLEPEAAPGAALQEGALHRRGRARALSEFGI